MQVARKGYLRMLKGACVPSTAGLPRSRATPVLNARDASFRSKMRSRGGGRHEELPQGRHTVAGDQASAGGGRCIGSAGESASSLSDHIGHVIGQIAAVLEAANDY